jgi:hypothetical protein
MQKKEEEFPQNSQDTKRVQKPTTPWLLQLPVKLSQKFIVLQMMTPSKDSGQETKKKLPNWRVLLCSFITLCTSTSLPNTLGSYDTTLLLILIPLYLTSRMCCCWFCSHTAQHRCANEALRKNQSDCQFYCIEWTK